MWLVWTARLLEKNAGAVQYISDTRVDHLQPVKLRMGSSQYVGNRKLRTGGWRTSIACLYLDQTTIAIR